MPKKSEIVAALLLKLRRVHRHLNGVHPLDRSEDFLRVLDSEDGIGRRKLPRAAS